MALDIPPELLESTKFRVPPQTEPRLDGRPRYMCVSQLHTYPVPALIWGHDH